MSSHWLLVSAYIYSHIVREKKNKSEINRKNFARNLKKLNEILRQLLSSKYMRHAILRVL